MAHTGRSEVVAHWNKLVENFETSPLEFYAGVEKALERRQVPGLTTSRVAWNEGGTLCPKREYLRITGDRHVFDICAAPFGTGFFFSSWGTGRKAGFASRLVVALLVLAPFLWKLPILFEANRAGALAPTLNHVISTVWIPALVGILIGMFLASLMARAGNAELELAVVATPILGWFYRAFFIQESYFRIDTMSIDEHVSVRRTCCGARSHRRPDDAEGPSCACRRGTQACLQPVDVGPACHADQS
jgi:hypothetical protein